MFSIDDYLARLGYTGPAPATEETLARLHELHMLEVPFENIDIHIGRKIVLDEERFFEKIVHERRGGFCYELNGAFAGLLRRLGFEVTMLSARVARSAIEFGPEFDHLTLLVTADGIRWLADVGFGDSFRRPLVFDSSEEQPGGDPLDVAYMIERTGDEFLLTRRGLVERERLYAFSLTPRTLSEFTAMCHYHQTSSGSSFTMRRLCTRATREGRITLAGDDLIVTTRRGITETAVENGFWFDVLRDRLGVDIRGH